MDLVRSYSVGDVRGELILRIKNFMLSSVINEKLIILQIVYQ